MIHGKAFPLKNEETGKAPDAQKGNKDRGMPTRLISQTKWVIGLKK